jgi:drug/metabolite transporter (DMT)-like permease
MKRLDLSILTILFSLGSFFSLILGYIFYKEPIGLSKILGIVLIIVSVIIVSIEKKKIHFNKNYWIVIVSTFLYALGATFDKKLSSLGNPLSYVAISFGIACMSIIVVYWKRTQIAFKTSFKKTGYKLSLLMNGLLYSFGFWALFEAYSRGGELSRMYPITVSTSVIIPIAAIIFLKERNNLKNKIIALLTMCLALWMLGK